jgi:hypothetical protein
MEIHSKRFMKWRVSEHPKEWIVKFVQQRVWITNGSIFSHHQHWPRAQDIKKQNRAWPYNPTPGKGMLLLVWRGGFGFHWLLAAAV